MGRLKDDSGNIGQRVPHWPRLCGEGNCRNDTNVTFLEVLQNGKRKTGVFSDFGFVKGTGENQLWYLHDGNTFVKWHPRCAECYMAALDKAGTAHGRAA